MNFKELFQLNIIHPYYSNEKMDLAIIQDIQTARFFKKRGLLKNTGNGLKILGLTDRDNNLFPISEQHKILKFNIFPTSTDFASITNITSSKNGEITLFTNVGMNNEDTELIKGVTVSHATYNGFPVIAQVEILIDEINTNNPSYEIVFATKSVKWKYYLLSSEIEQDFEPINFTVVDGTERLQFNRMNNDHETIDDVAKSLKSIFSETHKVIVFESDSEIPYSSSPRKNIQLKKNDVMLIHHLPNPQPKNQGIQIIKIK
ncbi:MAG: hypothetical protein MI922_19165 [Bacteroidales bacterium]|nr:hypothetical protein [Bacteroidales bacterium]